MKLLTRDEWLDIIYLDEKEEQQHRETIPAHFVAVDSELNGDVFDAFKEFFGKSSSGVYNVCRVSSGRIARIEKSGVKVFVSGDMTWVIFVDPTNLSKIWIESSGSVKGR